MAATLRYERRYPATINSAAETKHALAAATALVGAENVDTDPMPSMGSEDFAFMLQANARLLRLAGRQPRTGHTETCTIRITISTTMRCRSARVTG